MLADSDSDNLADGGESIVYDFTATNTGNVRMSDVQVRQRVLLLPKSRVFLMFSSANKTIPSRNQATHQIVYEMTQAVNVSPLSGIDDKCVDAERENRRPF